MVDVSRETMARLEAHFALLGRWQSRINLVGRATLTDPWRRHYLDSAQIAPYLAPTGTIVDLGSGAGFPGLVLAAMGVPGLVLVESDKRKATFLREAARAMEVDVGIVADRAESLAGLGAAAVTARAFAPLDRLLDLAAPLAASDAAFVLAKGAGADEELTLARRRWTMAVERFPSLTDPVGVILRLKGVTRDARG